MYISNNKQNILILTLLFANHCIVWDYNLNIDHQMS